MPQITLHHACIAEVLPDPKNDAQRIVKINVNEEDFFAMLDNTPPHNIIKYLDMRMIPHREAININVKRIDLGNNTSKKYLNRIVERNEKLVERARRLMEKYYGH